MSETREGKVLGDGGKRGGMRARDKEGNGGGEGKKKGRGGRERAMKVERVGAVARQG